MSHIAGCWKSFPNKPDGECDLKVKEVALFELRKKMEMKLTDAAFVDKLRSTKFYLDLLSRATTIPQVNTHAGSFHVR